MEESRNCTQHTPQPIPKYIHYIWFAFNTKHRHLSEKEKMNMDNCIRLNPGYNVTLWNETHAEQFISTHYQTFLNIYHSYWYPIQRNDLFRYAILHYYGGIYLDLDIQCVVPLDTIIKNSSLEMPGSDVITAREYYNAPGLVGWSGLLNSFIASPPRHPFLLECLSNLQAIHFMFLSSPHTTLLTVGAWYFARIYTKFPCKEQIRSLDNTLAYPDGIFMRHKFSRKWQSDNELQSIVYSWLGLIEIATALAVFILVVKSFIYWKDIIYNFKRHSLHKCIKYNFHKYDYGTGV